MEKKRKQVSLKQLRAWLGAERIKCYETISRSEVPSYQIGVLDRLSKSDVGQWLENHSSTTESR